MPVHCLLPRFVCRLGCFLNVEIGRSSVFVIEGFEVGGSGCFSNRGESSFQGVREKASCDCILCHRLDGFWNWSELELSLC